MTQIQLKCLYIITITRPMMVRIVIHPIEEVHIHNAPQMDEELSGYYFCISIKYTEYHDNVLFQRQIPLYVLCYSVPNLVSQECLRN